MIYWFLTASAGLFFFPAAGPAATQDFYQGKVIRIVVGFSPAAHLMPTRAPYQGTCEKYLPGNPTITVENMPGAGSLIAANHLYKAASPMV